MKIASRDANYKKAVMESEDQQARLQLLYPEHQAASSAAAPDGPGELSKTGRPRHDNDHADYRCEQLQAPYCI